MFIVKPQFGCWLVKVCFDFFCGFKSHLDLFGTIFATKLWITSNGNRKIRRANVSESFVVLHSTNHLFHVGSKQMGYVPIKKSSLSERNLQKRINFAFITGDWQMNIWTKLIFTDEKTFMSRPNSRIMVKRIRGTAFKQQHLDIIPIKKFSINVWGCMFGKDFTFRVYQMDTHFSSVLYRTH